MCGLNSSGTVWDRTDQWIVTMGWPPVKRVGPATTDWRHLFHLRTFEGWHHGYRLDSRIP